MVKWTESMQQTFEFYKVDPGTWMDCELIDGVKSCTINRDSTAETLGSATFDIISSVGECYIRVYLVTIQNGVREKHPLGTFLVQTPSSSFDGKVRTVTMDAYTPLLELKENPPPLGYYIKENSNVMETAYMLARENMRAPITPVTSTKKLFSDFISNTSDTWLKFLIDLIANAEYEFSLTETGEVLFSKKKETDALQPVWTFNDDNSSILLPSISMKHDLYNVPNVVEVIYSVGNKKPYEVEEGAEPYFRVKNDDPNSPTSIQRRGREIVYRDSNPNLVSSASENEVNEYARRLLKELSTLEYTISYTHGYCPVRIGDCVRLNYERAGITDIKARVVTQSIKCEPGCPVTETATFTTKLWG